MVRQGGIEPTARSLEGCCSIQLSYGTIGKTAPCGDDLRRKDRNFLVIGGQ